MARALEERGRLSRRELAFAIGGVVLGLAVVAVIWMLAGRSAAPELPAAGQVNRPAPEITLNTLDGSTVRLSDYRGTVVLVNFWGSWCEPCKRETPALQEVYQRLSDQGLVILGVNLFHQELTQPAARGTREGAELLVNDFVRQYGVTYPVLLDESGQVANDYRIFPIPTSFFIDSQGNIRYVLAREVSAEEIERLFRALVTPQ